MLTLYEFVVFSFLNLFCLMRRTSLVSSKRSHRLIGTAQQLEALRLEELPIMHLPCLVLSLLLCLCQHGKLSRHNDDNDGVGGIASRRLCYVSSTWNEQARSAASSLNRSLSLKSLHTSALYSNVHLSLLLSKHYLSWAKSIRHCTHTQRHSVYTRYNA